MAKAIDRGLENREIVLGVLTEVLDKGNFVHLVLKDVYKRQMYELNKAGVLNDLMTYGVRVKTAFCGPCFGASDAPGNNDLCIRHSTRNFPNREGSNPATGQIASVALMDSKSIACLLYTSRCV